MIASEWIDAAFMKVTDEGAEKTAHDETPGLRRNGRR